MSKKVKILDFLGNEYDTDVDIENVELVFVTVVSGDEILIIHTKDNDIKYFDGAEFSGNIRTEDHYEYAYTILEDELENWNERKDNYEYEEINFSN